MLPSHNDILYFIEVAQALNLSRASERLGIAQPTLSVSMKRLEEEIGAKLLIRSKTGVKLTRSGQRLLSRSQQLIADWRQLKSEVAKDETHLTGSYRLGCHTSVALYTLPHFVAELVEQHPEVELSLNHDLSRKINEDVINFKLDFGIVINPISHPDLVIKQICTDEVTLWAAPKNKNREVLICDFNLLQTQDIVKKLKLGKSQFLRTITTPDLEVVASLTAAGAGCGVLPSRVARRLKEFNLQKLKGNWPSFLDKVALVYRADTQKSPAAKELGHYILTQLKSKLS